MKSFLTDIRISLVSTFFLAVLLCGIYPLVVWTIAQGLFPYQANGSLIVQNGKVVGSALIAQGFTGPKYFHSRPSSAGKGYDATNSAGSNLGPISKTLIDAVAQRINEYRRENSLTSDISIPPDAVTASGSGLDPHISVENALLQTPRVAKARGWSQEAVRKKIEIYVEGRDLGIFGEPRVNVLRLNLALDSE
jgi:potassium-transporting ATPase KdpC subunit